MECDACGKAISDSVGYEDLGNGEYNCDWCSKNASCMHCSNGIEEDEAYQFCGNDTYVCETCSDKPGCHECDGLIHDDPVVVDGESYHGDCAPETE